MTFLAVRSGGAFEANPVVRFAGLPAKIALVGLLTWLLYRRKPPALVWPFAALLWVAGYHVVGILVNGWR
jgi:presenilin-like A22 family membrane protease